MSALDWYFLTFVAVLLAGMALWGEAQRYRERRRYRRRYYEEDNHDRETDG